MSEPYYSDESVTLYLGDSLDILATLPDASVDAIVTDPPYGLEFMGREWDGADGFRRSLNPADAGRDSVFGRTSRTSPEYRALHTFQQWCTAWATECLRVLKPGGHLLSFGGSRTWHRLACAVEDAGFEVRDSIAWLYGSGFPKSLDVSKAIDKRPGVSRHAEFAVHLAERREAAGMSRQDVSERIVGTRSGACWNWEHHQFPEAKWWPALRDLLDLDEATWGPVIAEAERQTVGTRTMGRLAVAPGQGADRSAVDVDVTENATDAARQWQGWGTALKPAFEPIVVARKPLAGTVAGNVLAHGTGALNIDGCRVASDGESLSRAVSGGGSFRFDGFATLSELEAAAAAGGTTPTGRDAAATLARFHKFQDAERTEPAGRWPTNVVLDDSQAAELDRQSGARKAGGSLNGTEPSRPAKDTYGEYNERREWESYGDTGGASRFFPVFRYEPKADTAERPRINGVAHPTVKPLALMRWLVRLVTPPGGTVLDPFAGSGTTVEAGLIEGFNVIAIERETDYLPLIEARIARRTNATRALELAGEDMGLLGLIDGEAVS